MNDEKLARLIADAASKSDAAHWPEAVAIALGPVIAKAQAEAWDRGMGDMVKLTAAGPGYEMGNPYRPEHRR